MKDQWVASVLIVPVLFLAFTTWWNYSEARQARIDSLQIDRVTLVQDSGKELDLALATYFHSISDEGLAAKGMKMPGDASVKTVAETKLAVAQARQTARKALMEHSSDVQRLRGTFDESASKQYMASLAEVSDTIENGATINKTGQNISVLSKLVVKRNALVDGVMDKVS